jgi:hypothetical protein
MMFPGYVSLVSTQTTDTLNIANDNDDNVKKEQQHREEKWKQALAQKAASANRHQQAQRAESILSHKIPYNENRTEDKAHDEEIPVDGKGTIDVFRRDVKRAPDPGKFARPLLSNAPASSENIDRSIGIAHAANHGESEESPSSKRSEESFTQRSDPRDMSIADEDISIHSSPIRQKKPHAEPGAGSPDRHPSKQQSDQATMSTWNGKAPPRSWEMWENKFQEIAEKVDAKSEEKEGSLAFFAAFNDKSDQGFVEDRRRGPENDGTKVEELKEAGNYVETSYEDRRAYIKPSNLESDGAKELKETKDYVDAPYEDRRADMKSPEGSRLANDGKNVKKVDATTFAKRDENQEDARRDRISSLQNYESQLDGILTRLMDLVNSIREQRGFPTASHPTDTEKSGKKMEVAVGKGSSAIEMHKNKINERVNSIEKLVETAIADCDTKQRFKEAVKQEKQRVFLHDCESEHAALDTKAEFVRLLGEIESRIREATIPLKLLGAI